jgi:RNA polymerase sigma-70 factor (ECF subfamily)
MMKIDFSSVSSLLFLTAMEDIHQHRPLLFSLAYNMLGEVQEAEDVVQDVFESWYSKNPDVHFPKAYLSRAVVNKSIDRLEALKKVREVYKGPWLPVPIVSDVSAIDDKQSPDPLSYALLNVLEKLNPVERAAFILRQAFDFPYSELAEICNLPEENARQIVHRAKDKLQNPRIRYEASIEQNRRLLNAFLDACINQDTTTLKEILHQDVVMYTDGGGKVSAAGVPVHGPEKIITFLKNILKNALDVFAARPVVVNGSAGALFINKTNGLTDTICTIETDGKKITNLYLIRNPDKILA